LAIKVPLIVKIAEKRMRIGEILKLSLGSVVQFEKDAYQHVDLMVNNSTIGLGQPVKVGEKFGLKITQIGDISEMIRSLGTGAQPDDSQ
jgi:flagellar motor switch protein FliN/FliY